jgi:WD40 repeat protein
MKFTHPTGLLTACLPLLLLARAPAQPAGKDYREVGRHGGGAASVHFSPDGKLLASAGGDKALRVRDVATGKVVHEFTAPGGFTCSVRFSPDGKFLAAAGYESGPGRGDSPVYVFDPASGKELARLPTPCSGVRRVVYTPDSKCLISGGFDGVIRFWDLRNFKEVRQVRAHPGACYSLHITPDGKTLASGGGDGIRLWDAATGQEFPAPALNRQPALAVAFSPDGRLLASGNQKSVRLWEVATGKEALVLGGSTGEVAFLTFSNDGRTLYSSSYDNKVRVWDARTGKPVRELSAHSNWVWGIALSPDEKALASCSYDGRVLLWDLTGVARPTPKGARLTARARQACWADLGGPDAGAAYRAACALAADPAGSVPFLRERLEGLKWPEGLSPARLARLLAELDADDFEVREQASRALERGGRQAKRALRDLLAKPPSLEARQRARRILARLPASLPAQELSAVRAVQALEYAGTREARKALEHFARGPAGSPLTEECAAALERLSRPVGVRP